MILKSGGMAMCTETSISTIIKYCEMGLLAPVSGRKNESINTFDPRQVPQIYMIKTLRELGFGMQELKEYGQNRTKESTARMLQEYTEQLTGEIAAMQNKLDIIRSYTTLLEEGLTAKPGIELRTLPEQKIRCSELRIHRTKTKNAEQLRHACGDIRQNGNAGCPMGFAYTEFADLLEEPNQPARLVSYDPNGPETRPAGEYLVGAISSYYGEKHALPQRMAAYAEKNDLEIFGPAYTVYLLDAVSVAETDEYLLQISAAVRRKDVDENEGDLQG